MRRTGKLEFAASRWIEPGEEITLDYGEDYFDRCWPRSAASA